MKNNYQKGIAIFVAVIAVSALMLIALAISDISFKEQIISYAGRDSRIAFYAADTGVECALFYDLKGGPDGTFRFGTPGVPGSTGVSCASVATFQAADDDGSQAITTFYFNPSSSPASCAIVRVMKTDAGGGEIDTRIESRGYNNNCDENEGETLNPVVLESMRNLERSFRVTY